MAKFQLAQVAGMTASDDELKDDLRRVAEQMGRARSVSARAYGTHGKYSHTTLSERFGSWNSALLAAGLEVSHENSSSNEELFENILQLWQHFGRQPRRKELTSPPSKFSQSPYNRSFGGWTNALRAFVEFANATVSPAPSTELIRQSRRTPRDPSLGLRFRVLQRDNFTCRSCGRSPATILGLVLHIDHIVPWCERGETLFENLQTLCEPCNLGKGRLHPTGGQAEGDISATWSRKSSGRTLDDGSEKEV